MKTVCYNINRHIKYNIVECIVYFHCYSEEGIILKYDYKFWVLNILL
jgi:hypothetical protein